MRKQLTNLGLVASLALASGCSSGQSNAEPSRIVANLGADRAQLAVGVATFTDGTTGLNTVATLRQANGLSGVLLDTPTITGPAGFLVPAGEGGVDGGTDHISASPQVPSGTPGAIVTTFGQSGGVFAYGFAADNSTTAGTAPNNVYDGAFYDDSGALEGTDSFGDPIEFRGGPPAYTNTLDPRVGAAYEPGFLGFTQGFTTFDTAPVAGPYSLSVVVAAANAKGYTYTASGTLTSVTGSLGAIGAAPAFAEDAAGGGTATCTVPAAATETVVDLVDLVSFEFFTVVVPGGGAVSATFADNIGAVSSTGVASPPIAAGDEYSVSCIAANYPLYEAGPPSNLQQVPTIVGSNGQADISFSPNFDSIYGGDDGGSHVRRALHRHGQSRTRTHVR